MCGQGGTSSTGLCLEGLLTYPHFAYILKGNSQIWNALQSSCRVCMCGAVLMCSKVPINFCFVFLYMCNSCGACGYALNLSSSQRVVSSLNSKALRKGTISFLCIDESRFKQQEELKCAPRVHSNGSMRLHQMRTKLLCGKCGNVVGHGHSGDGRAHLQIESSDSSSGSGTPEYKRYCVKIKALQPSLNLEAITPAAG